MKIRGSTYIGNVVVNDRFGSNSTPRLRAWTLGESDLPQKSKEVLVILERCWGVPKSRYSVLSGFTDRRFIVSQE